jgi:hypothetical protein
MALHVSIHRHFGGGLEIAKAALEFLDRDFVNTSDMLFKESSMFGNVSTLSAFVTGFSVV